MALSHFPLDLYSETSSLPFLHLQPAKTSFRTLKFKSLCSRCAIQLDTQESKPIRVAIDVDTPSKRKRSPRPSFFDEIREKWSSRVNPRTEKLPWQVQEDRIQQQQKLHVQEEEEEDEEREEKDRRERSSSFYSVTNAETDSNHRVVVSDPVSSPTSSRFIYAPWVHGSRPRKPQSNSEHEIANADSSNGANTNGFGRINGYNDTIVNGALEDASDEDDEFEFARESKNKEGSGDRGQNGVFSVKEKGIWRRSSTKLAERTIPEHELKRLRNVALRMLERIKVGSLGITQALVESIHEKWMIDEVVKLKFEEPLSLNMKRTHETLENKTGGLVIWRSGSSLVLYRGMNYSLPCVQSFVKQNLSDKKGSQHFNDLSAESVKDLQIGESVERSKELYLPESANYPKDIPKEELIELCELNHLLDELGPRFQDWTGREPVPVDSDMLPPIVPDYKTPFRLLPHGVRPCLNNKEMTNLRRLARTMPPHFALGRNRELQGLAQAMMKLWERSAIAKIVIKRGVENTRNERMAEELKRLTGGILLSRNKEFIVFYRGNDFLPRAVVEVLTERQKQFTEVLENEEDKAREMAATTVITKPKSSPTRLVAGTLAETVAATSRWAPQASSVDVEELKRESAAIKRASLIRNLEQRLVFAKRKISKAEKALAKLQEDLDPSELPTDSEIISNEERFLFRKIGLSMKPYLLLGRREVYDGTIENMHLHWKHRELVKIIVKGKNVAQVKHIAISLEAESGGMLISVDKTTKGYAVVVYRGKNYRFPLRLRPKNLLSRKQALARSIELQRREALKYHVADLKERIELLKSGQEMLSREKTDAEEEENFYLRLDDSDFSSEDSAEDEPEQNVQMLDQKTVF